MLWRDAQLATVDTVVIKNKLMLCYGPKAVTLPMHTIHTIVQTRFLKEAFNVKYFNNNT